MRIDIYSDTVCPWCYLGKRRFDLAVAARPQYEPVVVWRPFELNPDVPVEGVDRETFMAAKMPDQARLEQANAELERQGEASGIHFRFDLIIAHQVALHLLQGGFIRARIDLRQGVALMNGLPFGEEYLLQCPGDLGPDGDGGEGVTVPRAGIFT